ncbi:MAG: DUF3786 domain-containing protein [Gaiellales bacterium]|nr:MAG: DUF3786 domain-containing protein [Gaiellales bacterium]
MLAGEKTAWEKLEAMDPQEIAERCDLEYWEEEDAFVLEVFKAPFVVDIQQRQVREIGPHHHFHAGDSTHFSLIAPLYVASCRDVIPSGRLIAPQSVPGGQAFFKGPHELPLEVLAHHFGSNPDNFLRAGKELQAEKVEQGDAAVRVPTLPRMPVTIILWVGDLEFPARCQMLIDDTAPEHFPVDAIWATLILTAEAMIQVAGPHH